MSGDFIDTNVFVYLFDETDAAKSEVASAVLGEAVETGRGVISFQVVQEVLNLATEKFAATASPDRAARLMDDVLQPLWRVMPSRGLYERALAVKSRFGYHFYDSLIVAAALEAGCRRLLTEDMQHGQRIDGLLIENPFR